MNNIKEKIKTLVEKLSEYRDSNLVESLYVQLAELDTELISKAVRGALINTAWRPKNKQWDTADIPKPGFFGRDVYMSTINQDTGEVSFSITYNYDIALHVNLAKTPYSYIIDYKGNQYNLDIYEERVSLQKFLNSSYTGSTCFIKLVRAFIQVWPKIEESLYESITEYLSTVEGKSNV